jgi:outer membrane protein with beta-barrel domain
MKRSGEARIFRYALILCLFVAGSLGTVTEATSQEGWRVGADIGPFFKTSDGTVMGIGFNADYFVTEEFSVGPAVQFLPFGDLRQIHMAAVARYHVRTTFDFNVVPFAGVGIAYASGSGSVSPSGASDSSVLITNGITLEYQVTKKIAVALTGMINFYNLDLASDVGDRKSGAVLLGVRYQLHR